MTELSLYIRPTTWARIARRYLSNVFPMSPKRCWLGGLKAACVVIALVSRPELAAACEWYDPICFAEDAWNAAWGGPKDAFKLAWDIITLKPEDAWDDFVDIAYHSVCGQGP